MKPDEKEVKIKNAELTLASLRADSEKEAAVLTELLKAKEQVQADVAAWKENMSVEAQTVADERDNLKRERIELFRVKQEDEKIHARAASELKVLHDQKNQAMKELANLNDWNMKAEDERKAVQVKLDELNLEIEAWEGIRIHISKTQEEKVEAEKALQQVKIETALLIDETELKVSRLQSEGENAALRLTEALAGVQKAEEDLLSFMNEKAKAEKDLEVIVRRIEAKYGEAFPGLRMNI
ncbi:hypothetical protein KW807_02560 [Candidatus Parcubacteria bacterium]|nr:hypothetical protein [Candidatus Parcubacteria bacterium]